VLWAGDIRTTLGIVSWGFSGFVFSQAPRARGITTAPKLNPTGITRPCTEVIYGRNRLDIVLRFREV
jgi:hypothetical protein